MYTIREIQDISGLTASTLRYYENEGMIPNVQRDEQGRRMYTEEQSDWLKFIIALKDTGMTIEEIKVYMNLILAGEETKMERRDFLISHREKVKKQISKTINHLEKINQKVAYYDAIILGKGYL